MERNKANNSNRNQKKMSGHHGSEFFVLGTKVDSKSKVGAVKSSSSVDRKRETTSTVSSVSKKARLHQGLQSVSTDSSNSGLLNELWEQMATDCEPSEFVETIFNAMDQADDEMVLRLLCGCIRYIVYSNTRAKQDTIVSLAIFYIAKLRPDIFCNDIITSALIYILRRDSNVKNRKGWYSQIVASNLLFKGYQKKQQWPEIFLRTYIEDAVNERIWVDNSLCSPFIKNICSVFKTSIPTHSVQQQEITAASTTSGQPHREQIMNLDDDSCDNSLNCADLGFTMRMKESDIALEVICNVQNRFSEKEPTVEKLVMDAIKEQLNKRQQQDCYTRNFLKFLCNTSGFVEVRYLCITRLELWIHNGKLVKFAQQLLSYICFNINSKCLKDHEVLAMLVKMRLKTKPLINFYMVCLKEMLTQRPDILPIALKLVVQNELSNTRNPNNMGMLATMFQTSPEESASCLAEIYKEFLLQRDDCLRTLRVFLRELVRMLRYDVNISRFCKYFINNRPELIKQIENFEFRDRVFHSMVDLICLCMLLTVSPQVRESNLSFRTSRDVKLNQVMIQFYTQMSQIQLYAVSWMYETVPNLFKLQSVDYNQALHKILLLENAEQYSRCDQWPSEPERATLIRLISETPINEEALLRIILIGIDKDIPFTIPDTIDIIMLVIKRASAMRITNYPAVNVNKFDIIDFLFSMTEYHHPENIKLPADYNPPKLAITVLYWKAWLIMLMISAHNPSSFGAFCWDHYPTMKILIEMCITNQFSENINNKEDIQILTIEREHILEFESHLAAQTSLAVITEETAILISQLMLMDPMGPARRVPVVILDQLKYLNRSLKLGHLLCRSRKPDLLLDIIQRQGTTQSMPWLSDLVQNSEGDFNHLPVQCLCEFLMFNANVINEENTRDAELVNFLRFLITKPDSNKQSVCEVLDYIFRRLSSTVKQSRLAALEGIKLIFKYTNSAENDWLLQSIPRIPFFKDVCPFIIPQLRAACQVENSPELIMSYIQFIAAHTIDDSVTTMLDHVIDIAQLIVERSTMFQHIIPELENTSFNMPANDSKFQTLKCMFVMFNNYIIKLREHHILSYEWTEYPDILLLQFDDRTQLPLKYNTHLNIIHAFVILLTQSSNSMTESIPILDYWFPPGRYVPITFLPNLPHEPVHLLPDWLKLKMIRSPVDRLIEAALHELTPDQIVLFVQNFGTPVNSMSKLLALLDRAVIEQFDAVKNAILNKAYLAQLIEIQRARGAKNGHFTIQALDLHCHSQTVPDYPKLSNHTLRSIDLKQFQSTITHVGAVSKINKEIEEVVNLIIKTAHLNNCNEYRFRRIIHQLLGRYGYTAKSRKDSQIVTSSKIFVFLMRLIERCKVQNLYQSVMHKNHMCSFFRALFMFNPTTKEDYNFMMHIIREIMSQMASRLEKTQNASKAYYDMSLSYILKSKNDVCCKSYVKTTQEFSLNERNLRKVLSQNECLQQTTASANLQIDNTNSPNKNILSNNGLLVDWLAEADPELIIVSKSLQTSFLFSKECFNFRFYLLSLICHQTNWKSLISTVNYLLQQSEISFDCTTVLNFVEALINNPKLWQGHDRNFSKTNQPEIIFSLSHNELYAFTELILKEGEIEFDTDPLKYDFKICSRINLLFRVTHKKSNELLSFIEYVFKSSCSQALRLKVLQQMYLMFPSIKYIRCKETKEHTAKLRTLKGCQADKVSNYLVTCLGNLILKKDFETLSSDVELLIRKLAASHPSLFLRQLGVLSSLIQGKAQINLYALRDGYHFHRFIQILRTLELLQPMLFDDAYKNEFHASIECYFAFFKQHCYIKEVHHILIKFIELLQSYINFNPSSALLFIEQYVDILMELSTKFNSVAPLHQLVQCITLLQRSAVPSIDIIDEEIKQDIDLEEHVDSKYAVSAGVSTEIDSTDSLTSSSTTQLDITTRGAVSLTLCGSQNKNSMMSPHFMNLIKIIKHSNAEDAILGPLQEVESLTSKRFAFLTELFDRLLELIFSHSAQIRSNAFILLIRNLKHNPGRSDINRCALNAYIQCLRDDNSSVAATAVDNLAEIALLLQEHSVEILSVAFSLGIRSRLNTSTQIKRVLQTLQLQHGY